MPLLVKYRLHESKTSSRIDDFLSLFSDQKFKNEK